MADQAGSGTVVGGTDESGTVSQESGTVSPAAAVGPVSEPFHGRPVSWVSVAIVMFGFLLGGLALVFGPVWWLFWVAVGLTAVGGFTALGTGIFNDWY